jgi:hypothetical protein
MISSPKKKQGKNKYRWEHLPELISKKKEKKNNKVS